jgi:hypothetical protein
MISANQQKRIDKLNEDEFYLIGFDGKEILMTGSKKDVYTINLGEDGSLKCNCPDSCNLAKKLGVVCKHICFIYIKICKGTDLSFFQKQKLTSTDIGIFNERTKRLTATDIAKQFYNNYKAHAVSNTLDFDKSKREGVLEDMSCPICFDDLTSNIKFCPTCSNPVHEKCIEKWLEKHKTCIYCRSDIWKLYGSTGDGQISKYVNVAK